MSNRVDLSEELQRGLKHAIEHKHNSFACCPPTRYNKQTGFPDLPGCDPEKSSKTCNEYYVDGSTYSTTIPAHWALGHTPKEFQMCVLPVGTKLFHTIKIDMDVAAARGLFSQKYQTRAGRKRASRFAPSNGGIYFSQNPLHSLHAAPHQKDASYTTLCFEVKKEIRLLNLAHMQLETDEFSRDKLYQALTSKQFRDKLASENSDKKMNEIYEPVLCKLAQAMGCVGIIMYAGMDSLPYLKYNHSFNEIHGIDAIALDFLNKNFYTNSDVKAVKNKMTGSHENYIACPEIVLSSPYLVDKHLKNVEKIQYNPAVQAQLAKFLCPFVACCFERKPAIHEKTCQKLWGSNYPLLAFTTMKEKHAAKIIGFDPAKILAKCYHRCLSKAKPFSLSSLETPNGLSILDLRGVLELSKILKLPLNELRSNSVPKDTMGIYANFIQLCLRHRQLNVLLFLKKSDILVNRYAPDPADKSAKNKTSLENYATQTIKDDDFVSDLIVGSMLVQPENINIFNDFGTGSYRDETTMISLCSHDPELLRLVYQKSNGFQVLKNKIGLEDWAENLEEEEYSALRVLEKEMNVT